MEPEPPVEPATPPPLAPPPPPPPPPRPTIRDVADIVAYNGFVEAARLREPNGNSVLSPDALATARTNYYNNVPNMSLATLRRERNPDIIPQMTIQQLRTLSDELYLTMTPNELRNRYNHFLQNNQDFPEEINDPNNVSIGRGPRGRGFYVLWDRGGIENSPTNLFDHHLRLKIEHYQEWWREYYERMYFETIYRALITPIPNGGGKRTRRTKRRKTRKSRKNKRKTKRRRA